MERSINNNENVKSDLDLWFRRQGINKSALDFESPSRIKLPRIREVNEPTNIVNSNANNNNKQCSKISSQFISNSNPNFSSTKPTDRCRTPHLFYQRCIDEVTDVNHPDDLDLKLPRELVYVRSLPFIRYVTYGTGKCFNSMWQLEMKAQA